MVHNSVGLQCSPEAPCEFIVNRNELQRPVDFLAPADGRGWIWFQSGLMIRNRLYLFLAQFEKPSNSPPSSIGSWAPGWRLSKTRSRPAGLVHQPGAPAVLHLLQVSGCHLRAVRSRRRRSSLCLRRRRSDSRFQRSPFSHGRPRPSRSDCRDGSVAVLPARTLGTRPRLRIASGRLHGRRDVDCVPPGVKKYLAVYTDTGISSRIVARTAPTPVGPWSGVTTLHRCHEATGDPRLFCYAERPIRRSRPMANSSSATSRHRSTPAGCNRGPALLADIHDRRNP